MKPKTGLLLAAAVVVLIVAVALAALLGSGEDQSQPGDARLETSAFSVAAPPGVMNESATSDSGTIYLVIPKPYGEMRVLIKNETSEVTTLSQRGQVTTSEVDIAGTKATKKEIDYSGLSPQTSGDPRIRYEISFEKIDKPSDEKYSTFSSQAYGPADLTPDQVAQFRADTQALLDTLIIKR